MAGAIGYQLPVFQERKVDRFIFLPFEAEDKSVPNCLQVWGELMYRQRLATAEPPFAHRRHAKGLHRFTLRGMTKVNTQWRLYCLVHNLIKVHQFGPGFA